MKVCKKSINVHERMRVVLVILTPCIYIGQWTLVWEWSQYHADRLASHNLFIAPNSAWDALEPRSSLLIRFHRKKNSWPPDCPASVPVTGLTMTATRTAYMCTTLQRYHDLISHRGGFDKFTSVPWSTHTAPKQDEEDWFRKWSWDVKAVCLIFTT